MDKLSYAYYPGCTQETTASEYNESAKAVCWKLGIELVEMPGWICCGASSGHATDYWLSHTLAGKNLAIAEKLNKDVAVSCPACYLRLNATIHEFKNEPKLREKLPDLISETFKARSNVRHLLDIIRNSVGLETVRSNIVKPLAGLKVVANYGCYLVRPPELTGFDDTENPQSMDSLLKSLGAEVPDWRGKVSCCGGSHSFTLKERVTELVSEIAGAAREVGAEAIVTACPLCQVNLETRQSGKDKLPVFYFTELMCLAFGIDSRRWLARHMIDPNPPLKKHGLI
jgi:heterodisulfide reductase subunit B2